MGSGLIRTFVYPGPQILCDVETHPASCQSSITNITDKHATEAALAPASAGNCPLPKRAARYTHRFVFQHSTMSYPEPSSLDPEPAV